MLVAAYCGGLCLALAVRPPGWGILDGRRVRGGRLWSSRCSAPPGAVRAAWLTASPVGLVALFLVAGVGVGGARIAALERSALAAYVGRGVDVRATLTDLPQVKDDRVTLALDVTRRRRGAPSASRRASRCSSSRGRSQVALEPRRCSSRARGWPCHTCASSPAAAPPGRSTTAATCGVAAST